MGTFLGGTVLVACLVVELIMLVVSVSLDKDRNTALRDGVLFDGDCDTAKSYNTFLSLPINIVGTLILAISNYLMQCLSSPSGPELSQAHARGRSLRLGVSSPFNIFDISPTKTILWWTMVLSSLPVHLLLNSSFFLALQTTNYGIIILPEGYDMDGLHSQCAGPSNASQSWSSLACEIITNTTNLPIGATYGYERVENKKCIERYSQPFTNGYANVVLVTSISRNSSRFQERSIMYAFQGVFTLNR
jgi:hypothetical protein